jgi:hypothetical protein
MSVHIEGNTDVASEEPRGLSALGLRDLKLRHVRKGSSRNLGDLDASGDVVPERSREDNERGRGSRSRSTAVRARTWGNLAEGPC